MLISNWSSDVCASRSVASVEGRSESDQLVDASGALVDQHPHGVDVAQAGSRGEGVGEVQVGGVGVAAEHGRHSPLGPAGGGLLQLGLGEHADAHPRSEEHTSELQSLMRISYAGFCLKKKKNKQHTRRALQSSSMSISIYYSLLT